MDIDLELQFANDPISIAIFINIDMGMSYLSMFIFHKHS